jgi:subtilase family serine protease
VSAGDQSKVVAWLNSEGLTVGQMGRGRNWVSFSGTAAQVSNALHTSLHRFQVNGEAHFANTIEPEVPEALSGIVDGFLGLNDFRLKSFARPVPLPDPSFTSGASTSWRLRISPRFTISGRCTRQVLTARARASQSSEIPKSC